MLANAIRPAQLRALLLLLVLVPLVPTVLLLRFVDDMADGERAAVRTQAEALYSEIVTRSGGPLLRSLASRGTTPTEVQSFYEELLGPGVIVEVSDEQGRSVSKAMRPGDAPLAQVSLAQHGLPWLVRIYAEPARWKDHLPPLTQTYAGSAALLVLAIFAVAAAAGVTLNRQLTLQDLKSTAVATVAHELRTPLASIRMLVDTIREGRCREETQRNEYMEMIASELERLTRVTEQFLTHSRLERGRHGFHLSPVAPAEVADAAVQLLRERLYAPKCHFTLQVFPGVPLLHADRGAIMMVLANLLENALKYTGAEKTITLRVRPAGGSVLFEVIDNGIGIGSAERRTIFQPFRQTDQRLSRSREGCGLGLSIVRQIVEAHGGRISVDSRPGRGSCFALRMPALSLPSTPAAPTVANVSPPAVAE